MKDGIYKDLTIQAYHENKTHLNFSGLKWAKKSLKDFACWRAGVYDRKATFLDFGNAFEIALLCGAKDFDKAVTIFDPEDRPEKDKGITSKINQEWKQAILNSDGYVINKTGPDSFEILTEMLNACYQDAVIQKLLSGIDYQTSIFWTDPKTGMQLKTRPDICKLNKNVVVNLKTARDGSPEAFSRELANLHYPLQACMEMRGVVASGLMPVVDVYYWLVVEKEPPYCATLYEFAHEDQEYFNSELDYLINKVNEATKKNFFPGYSDRADNKYGILTAAIPLWYRNQI